MNLKLTFVATALCGLIASPVIAEPTPGKSRTDSTPPPASSSAKSTTPDAAKPKAQASKNAEAKATPAAQGSTIKPSSELAASMALEEANKDHIRPGRAPLIVPTPPPAPRTDTKPPAPAAGLVWVPGHWIPVKGEWQWRAGEWGFPATPISVWIEPSYDAKTKQWTAGYWQPDREEPYDSGTRQPDEDKPPTPKFL